MSLQVTLSNNKVLTINRDTRIYAWKGTVDTDSNKNNQYYAEAVFEGALHDGEGISTSDERVGIQGLFSNCDWFTIDSESHKLFKTSSIVSIEEK